MFAVISGIGLVIRRTWKEGRPENTTERECSQMMGEDWAESISA